MKTKTSLLYGVMLIISSLLTNTLFAQFATTSLNNLTGTQINKSLVPKKNNTIDLGSSAKSWANLMLSGSIYNGTTRIMAIYDFGNTFLGKNAGINNASNNNTFVGENAGFSNTDGYSNTAVGVSAGYSLSAVGSGNGNVFIGALAGYSVTGGGANVYVGANAGYSTTNAGYNTFCGTNTGFSNGTGSYNAFFGDGAGGADTTGNENAFMGDGAGGFNQSGNGNVAIGQNSGMNNISGSINTFLGVDAQSNADGYNYSSALGEEAVITASEQVRVGSTDIASIGGYQDWTNISDGRFKKNIQENVKGLEFIDKLRPITYNLDITGLNKFLGVKSSSSQNANDAAIQQKEKIVNSGFIAQEVEQTAKEVGYNFSGVDAPKNDHDVYGLRYAEFVVPLVKSVQELSAENDQLKSMIADLQSQVNELKNGNNSTKRINTVELNGARLEQNAPNPFNQSTTINYYLPEKCNNAILQIISSGGEVIKSLSLPQNGNGQLILKAGEFVAGSYSYQLVIDGKIIDSKQMILTR